MGTGDGRSGPLTKPERFVWPPGRVDGPLHAQTTPTLASRLYSAASAALRCVERDWLGVEDGTWHQRVIETGWRPDEAGEYCPWCGREWGAAPDTEEERERRLCPSCDAEPVPWTRCVRLGRYEGGLREAILEAKTLDGRATGEHLGEALGQSLLAVLDRAQVAPEACVLVPVPMSLIRWLLRGRDHSLALARGLRRVTGIPIVRGLGRAYRPQQKGTSATRRRKNVAGSMWARSRLEEVLASRSARVVIVVDDVMTSGATLRESVRAMQGEKFFSDLDLEVWVAVAGVVRGLGDRRGAQRES